MLTLCLGNSMLIAPASFSAAAAAAPVAAPDTAAGPAVPPAAARLLARPVAAPAPALAAPADAGKAVASTLEVKAAREAVAALNKRLEPMGTSVRFELDSSTGKTVIVMLDTADNTVLHQFPSEETLAMARALDRQRGLLINTTS